MDSISTLPPPPSHILDAALKEEAKYVGEMGAKILTIKEAEPYFKDILFRLKIGARVSPIGEIITKNLQRLQKELERGGGGADAVERAIGRGAVTSPVNAVVGSIEPFWAEDGAKRVAKLRYWTSNHMKKEAFKIVAFKNGKVPKLRRIGALDFIEIHYDSIRLDRTSKMTRAAPQDQIQIHRIYYDSYYGARYGGWSEEFCMGHDSLLEGISVWTGLEIWKKNKYEKTNYLTFQRKYEDMINADFIKPMPIQHQTYHKLSSPSKAVLFLAKHQYRNFGGY
jgi:hypothetical protein